MASVVLLFSTQCFFLWMFLASEGLELIADAGQISGPSSVGVKAAAYRYAAEWRHGMAGDWPLYMPGFFVSAIATWVWCAGRRVQTLFLDGSCAMALALLVAIWLAPAGMQTVVEAFQNQTGYKCAGVPSGPTWVGISRGIYTLLTWSVFVIASEQALMRRTVLPFLIPLAMSVVLAVIRPFTLDDLALLWLRRALEADVVAVLSFVLVPVVGAFLVLLELSREGFFARRPKVGT